MADIRLETQPDAPFEIEVIEEPFDDMPVPVPGGCNSSCNGGGGDIT